jgi:hypothetical protein
MESESARFEISLADGRAIQQVATPSTGLCRLSGIHLARRNSAAKFNVEKIKPQDLAGAAGPPDEET